MGNPPKIITLSSSQRIKNSAISLSGARQLRLTVQILASAHGTMHFQTLATEALYSFYFPQDLLNSIGLGRVAK